MRTRTLVSAALLWLLAGCAVAPRPGDPGYAYNANGLYVGRLMVDGQPFNAELELSTAPGGRVSGTFRVGQPFGIDGRVVGVVIEDFLRLTVTYRDPSRDACSGQIEGILTVEEGGEVVEGPVTVADCGDPVGGRMSFRR